MSMRNWLITGISSGLGAALAKAVMNDGDFVIGTFRQQRQVDTFNEQHEGKDKAYLLDLRDVESIASVVENVLTEIGKVDVLVNNAGVGFIGAVEEASVKEVRQVFEVNVFGALKMTQAVLPQMRKERAGRIIQISSHGGLKAFAGFGIYNASKFALEGFSEALAQEVAPLGIKVSIVEPGPFRTNFAGSGLGEASKIIEDYNDTAGAFRAKLKGVHDKQEGDPDKAAQAIIDLSKSDSPSLRLPLGKTALMTIGMKLDSVKADLENNRAVAENAVFE
ncbi:MAG: oxidoreductase [Bacteroidota bacterium]